MKPSGYQPRDFLWKQQGDPRWSWKKVALSGKTIAAIGCAILANNYIWNRYLKDHGLPFTRPNNYIDWLNAKARNAGYRAYLTAGGALYWNSLNEYSGGKLRHQMHPFVTGEKGYTMTEYRWGNITHWTVNLNRDLAYNSYPTTLVPFITYRSNQQWIPTGRKQYYKIVG